MVDVGIMKKLIFGFSTIVLLLMALGVFSLMTMKDLALETQKIYDHPFTVTTAVKNINIHLISMHRYMKDVVLAKDSVELQTATTKVNLHEQQIIEEFDIIFEKYLGNKFQVQKLYQEFIAWRPIREQVIHLSISGKYTEAAYITKNSGAIHVEKLNKSIKILTDFAQSKAEEFYKNSDSNRSSTFIILTTLFIIVTVLSLFIAVYVIVTSVNVEKTTSTHMHLIDQNIMFSTLDIQGRIIDITNEFCRYLGLDKQEAIATNATFLTHDNETQNHEIARTLMSGKTWEGEIELNINSLSTSWIHALIQPNYDTHFVITSFSYIAHDITDKKVLERLSITDQLTSLYNRRHFDNIIAQEFNITRRQKKSLIFAIIDIDFFKNYNDYYGHPAGDRVLTQVSATLKKALKRANDYVFRLGGEEFGIIFSDADFEKTEYFLNLLKQTIEDLQIAHEKNSVSPFLTISIGAYILDADNLTSIEDLYQKADDALYEAKTKRNHAVIKPLPSSLHFNKENDRKIVMIA